MIREATTKDIPQLQRVRNMVKENILSDPALVTDEDCREFLTQRGKGWVYEIDNRIVGFAIADLKAENIWALFLDPEYEGRGIGRQLHDQMLNWYFSCGKKYVWLGTDPGTRAAHFYRKAGWTETGKLDNGEIKFEMTMEEWQKLNPDSKFE